MALTSSLYSGVSGLVNMGNAMQVIGDNIANVNTNGFKGARATFQDIMAQSINTARGGSQVGRGSSMSDVAASGGYYIAVGCDSIVVQPSTITGSIGVFGIMFNIQGLLNNKLGITSDHVQTGYFSDLYNATRPKTPYELRIFQKQTETVYDVFVKKCAESRGMTTEQIKALASGRVWTGADAVDNGLADLFGNLDTAVNIAAEKAGVGDDYKVRYYPAQKDPFTELLESLSGDMEAFYMHYKLQELYPLWKETQKLRNIQGIQARMPFGFDVHF